MSSVTFSTTVGGDGSTVTDDDDATTGLRNGGWRTRFVPALTQEVAVAANAVASATAALSSKNAAASSASAASSSASAASTSATNAANSETAAAASYDSFDDRYLGVKTSDPSVDNDGNALLVGALYWNSATSVFKVWSGSVWITNLTSNQFGTNVATFLQTPSSANLAAALTDETGTAGKVVFDTNPTFPAQINLTANSGYNIYATGTADNYLAGKVGIGVTPSAGRGLTIAGTGLITGAVNGFSLLSAPVVAADVTGDYNVFRGVTTTAASAFTLANAINFVAAQGVIGAGSSITNQYGFQANETLTGATNNYGFYGAINASAGATRYNLYMAGSAPNYMAGDLTIGSTLSTGVGVTTGDAAFELGGSRTGNGAAYIDIHSATGTDYETRIIRASGANGALQIIQSGTGEFQLQTSGAAPMTFLTNATERIRIHESTGNVGIGTSSPDASAIIDAQSTTKGVRFPNMTTTQKLAIASPAAGLVVFDTTLSKLCVYTGAAWQTITSV